MIKEGKRNSWEIVCDNISIKEADYRGSKDVSRMENVILLKKMTKKYKKECGEAFLGCLAYYELCKDRIQAEFTYRPDGETSDEAQENGTKEESSREE